MANEIYDDLGNIVTEEEMLGVKGVDYEEIQPLSTDHLLSPKEELPSSFKKAMLGGVGLGGLVAAQKAFRALIDTRGYGSNVPFQEKYQTKLTKRAQMWNNAMQLAKNKQFPKLAAWQEIGKALSTEQPLELTAGKSSIEEVQQKLLNPKLTANQRAKLELELASRVKNLKKRRFLLANHYRASGVPFRELPFSAGPDYIPEEIRADKTLAKIGGLKEGEVYKGVRHTGEQITDFRGIANRDPRVSHVRRLLADGKLTEAKKAAKEAHYKWGKSVIKPKLINVNGNLIPVNKAGEQMGMKLERLSGEKHLWNGKPRTIYRLGFVPKVPQGLGSKLEYVAGQHWQYMDFIKTEKGFFRFRGGMRDVHNLMPSSYGPLLVKAEQLFLDPIVNHSDWKHNVITDKAKIGNKKWNTGNIKYLTNAFREEFGYGKSVPAHRETIKRATSSNIAKKAGGLLVSAITRGKIKPKF